MENIGVAVEALVSSDALQPACTRPFAALVIRSRTSIGE